MILLVSNSSRAQECAEAIERKTHQKTKIAASLGEAREYLARQGVDVLVIDESMQHAEGGVDGLVDSHAGTAVPIYANLSIHAAGRVAQEVNCGLQRVLRERSAAVQAVAQELRNELRGEVTAILLNVDLAMRETNMPPGAAEKIRVVREMADRMRAKLSEVAPDAGGSVQRLRLVEKQATPRAN